MTTTGTGAREALERIALSAVPTGLRRPRLVSRRRTVECLRCGVARRVGRVEGECPGCGYVGWKPARRRLVRVALAER